MDQISNKEIIRSLRVAPKQLDERRPPSSEVRSSDLCAGEANAHPKTVRAGPEGRGWRETDRQNEKGGGRLPGSEQDRILRPMFRVSKLHSQSQGKSGLQRPASPVRVE